MIKLHMMDAILLMLTNVLGFDQAESICLSTLPVDGSTPCAILHGNPSKPSTMPLALCDCAKDHF